MSTRPRSSMLLPSIFVLNSTIRRQWNIREAVNRKKAVPHRQETILGLWKTESFKVGSSYLIQIPEHSLPRLNGAVDYLYRNKSIVSTETNGPDT